MIAELEKRGVTRNELAREIGVNSGVLSRWLSGKRQPELQHVVAVQRIVPAAEPALWLVA